MSEEDSPTKADGKGKDKKKKEEAALCWRAVTY